MSRVYAMPKHMIPRDLNHRSGLSCRLAPTSKHACISASVAMALSLQLLRQLPK